MAEPPAPVDQEPEAVEPEAIQLEAIESAETEAVEEPLEKAPAVAGDADYLDDLEFLESLSLGECDGVGGTSALLDEGGE